MTSPGGERRRSLTSIVEAAIHDFNGGHISALLPTDGPGAHRRIEPDAATAAIDERPFSVSHIAALDAGRVFCALVTAHGNELVGVYSLANDRIAHARHYFSDFATLVHVGILDHDDGQSTGTSDTPGPRTPTSRPRAGQGRA